MNRRDFLKAAGVAGAALTGGSAEAEQPAEPIEFAGVLVDTTRCIGCRSCEKACSEEHGLPVPDIANDNALVAERQTSDTQWTIVNRYETSKGEVFVKKQCFHCWQPACVAACLTNAMYKTTNGPVIWRPASAWVAASVWSRARSTSQSSSTTSGIRRSRNATCASSVSKKANGPPVSSPAPPTPSCSV